MKPCDSELIDQFMRHYTGRSIVATDCPEWRSQLVGCDPQTALRELVHALYLILEGHDPKVALGIRRTRGKPSDDLLLALSLDAVAWWLEVRRQPLLEKQKWLHVKEKADAWLAENGREPMGVPALQKLLKHWFDEAARLEDKRRDKPNSAN